MTSEQIMPPPWTLTGYGYILLYNLPADLCARYAPHGKYRGGLSGLIIANYQTSDVGSYGELIFIPGVVEYPQTKGYSVGKIYVSTMESVINGVEHWALPKQLADFEFKQADDQTERVTVSRDTETPFASITFKSGGIPFPINGALLPKVHQVRDGRAFVTRLKSRGWGKLARVIDCKFNDEFYPDLAPYKPLAGIKVTTFTMEFPMPVIKG